MWRFALRRLAFIPIIAMAIGALTFVLLRVLPGDIAIILCGQNCTEERVQEIREALELDRPIFPITGKLAPPFLEFRSGDQYTDWMRDVATGTLGTSLYGGKDVLEEVTRRLPISFEIMVLT